MSLPPHFETPEEYFKVCLEFFRDYQYLFKFPNTELLIHNILDQIDVKNEDLDIFDANTDLMAADDEFLKTFFDKLKKLQVFREDFKEDCVEDNINVPLSPKKKHEIVYLAKKIEDVCKHVGCEVVVDLGSGLGYLDQLLFETTNYKVLGIECNENHYVGAKKRQRKYHTNSMDNVKYIKHTVTEDSQENIQNYVQEKFQGHKQFCLTGLHACANLTIDAINLFLKIDNAKAMIIMPCCYHKMVENGSVKNFPLSKSLKSIFSSFYGEEYLTIPFLRLAAQPPSVSDKLEDLVFNLLSRAVLQLYAYQHNCKLKRNKRKAVKTKTMDNNFETYLQDATTHGFTLSKNEPLNDCVKDENSKFNLEELVTLWQQFKVTFKKMGIFILLQNYLQPIIENFILFDRLVYLKEHGVEQCKFIKILNENISPRCLALLAFK